MTGIIVEFPGGKPLLRPAVPPSREMARDLYAIANRVHFCALEGTGYRGGYEKLADELLDIVERCGRLKGTDP